MGERQLAEMMSSVDTENQSKSFINHINMKNKYQRSHNLESKVGII